jgi:hypothetical protein
MPQISCLREVDINDQLYTALGQHLVRLLLVHPEIRVIASISAKEEIAEGGMM